MPRPAPRRPRRRGGGQPRRLLRPAAEAGAAAAPGLPPPHGAPDAFTFDQLDLADRDATRELFERVRPEVVVHLAAQAGVRLSISRPEAYVQANLVGFANVLEGCRRAREAGVLAHLLYASSSSVYGGDDRLPFDTHDPYAGNHPVSLYAATKRSNELMAHAYSHLYGLPTTSLRFFTVYGGWGRPDMAYWRFAEAIAEGRPHRAVRRRVGGARLHLRRRRDGAARPARATADPSRRDLRPGAA